jgi:glycosyltransferase involved in cell wall biosynthesis
MAKSAGLLMKLLFTDIHHGNGGGHVTYVMSLIRGLKDRHDITLAAPATGRLYRYASQIQGIRVVPALYTSRLPVLLREVAALRRFLQREAFDVVHVNGSADHRHVMLARMGLPSPPAIVWTKHNLHPVTSAGHRLRAWAGTNAVIAVSHYVAKVLGRSPYRKLPVNVIQHGIDTQHYCPVPAARKTELRRKMPGLAPEDGLIVLGSTGGTDVEKGWLDVLEGIALLPEQQQHQFGVVVAGDPPGARAQARLASIPHHARLVFPGLVDDVRDILGACDIGFVLSHREALSYACRESLAMGLPTLVSNAGGLPENLVSGEHGWIVPAGDAPAIAKVLATVVAEPKRLATIGAAARRHAVQAFALDGFVAATEQVYRSVARTL